MTNIKKLTLLHSNDMHGDFLAETVDEKLVGGVSLLSGYLNQVRNTEKNVLYCIAGDMFRGSLIDSEYKGISTIKIMNYLSPDVVTLGNHEVDYGISHLLFIEKCAKFPIINANIYLTMNNVRLFNSHLIKEIDGMKILFIGLLTEEVLTQTKNDKLIGSLVNVEDAAQEVRKIVNAYQTEDIDFTVLLTHIGIEADIQLAKKLDPRLGVDVIIGGHSHTALKKPCIVHGIPIVQAACGTDQIGRFDMEVDTDNNCIHSFKWELVPIDSTHCVHDPQVRELIYHYKDATDQKYNRIVTRFASEYTHPARNMETELGKVFADSFKDMLGVEMMFVGSGSIRGDRMGPVVRYRDLLEVMPYNDEIYRIFCTGKQLRHMICHILRKEALQGGHTEFYQFSHGLRIVYQRSTNTLQSLTLNGADVKEEQYYSLALQGFTFNNLKYCLDTTIEEVSTYRKPRVIATNGTDVLEEYFSHLELLRVSVEQRLILVD